MLRPTIAFIAALTIANPALAQACFPRDALLQRLSDTYGETRRAMGLAANNAVIEVFASRDSGSWTITITGTDGISCLIAAGQAYEAMGEARAPNGEPM